MSSDTEQSGLIRNEKGQIIGGTPPAGFNVNPQNRNPGGWNKHMVFSYQYRRFMNMTVDELEQWNKDTPKNKRTVVEDLAFKRVLEARDSLADVKEITDRTEGKAHQSIRMDAEVANMNRFDGLSKEDLARARKLILDMEKKKKAES